MLLDHFYHFMAKKNIYDVKMETNFKYRHRQKRNKIKKVFYVFIVLNQPDLSILMFPQEEKKNKNKKKQDRKQN